ncbi:MAG: hypothetical protein ACF8LK_01965 [Phycisphaerales bacterium JB041]
MTSTRGVRTAAAAAVVAGLATAASAGPLFIFEQSAGSFTVAFEDANTRNILFETAVTFEVGGLGIVSIDGDYIQTFSGGSSDPISGTAVFEGASNLDTLTVSFDGVVYDNGFGSFSGSWELTGSTGAYAQYTSGEGNNSGSYFFTTDDSGNMYTIFQGTLVPTPGVLAIGGLGAGMLATRRRRA